MEELRHLKVKEIKNMADMDARQHEAHLKPKLTIENGIEEYRDDLPPDYSRQGPEEHPWSDRVAAALSAILSDYWKQLPLNPEGASSRPNVGFHRSPALTDAASIVRYWRSQLTACRNNIGLSAKIIRFATKQDLPTEVAPLGAINRALPHLLSI